MLTSDPTTGFRLDRGLMTLGLIAAPGLLALLAEPIHWLVTTWTDPSWDSNGWLMAMVCLVLLMRSVRSGPVAPQAQCLKLALGLVLTTAGVRLAGRLLAVNVLGALALVVDVAALGLALGLSRRPWPVQPLALAGLFAFALPVEQILQRLLGFPLRLVSAMVAHGALSPFANGLERSGTLITGDGLSLAVDLPCSGAQGLMLLGALGMVIACRKELNPARLCLGTIALMAGALLANVIRIVLLYLGLQLELAVMAEPLHSALGLLALGMGCAPLLALARRWPARKPVPTRAFSRKKRARKLAFGQALTLAGVFSLAGLAIAAAPARPLDISTADRGPILPVSIGHHTSIASPLSPLERNYFERYGGQAQKRTYSDASGQTHSVVVVSTTSPLRHLHGPDRCLIGSGHRVRRLGVRPGDLPSVVWRSRAPDGSLYRVEAWFVDERGQGAASLSEVVWRWLGAPGTRWNLIERISAWQTCQSNAQSCRRFDAALLSALDLGQHPHAQKSGGKP